MCKFLQNNFLNSILRAVKIKKNLETKLFPCNKFKITKDDDWKRGGNKNTEASSQINGLWIKWHTNTHTHAHIPYKKHVHI